MAGLMSPKVRATMSGNGPPSPAGAPASAPAGAPGQPDDEANEPAGPEEDESGEGASDDESGEGGGSSGDDDSDQGDKPNVTPQEQAQYDDMMHNGLNLIYPNGQLGPQIAQALSAGSDPKTALANVTVMIVKGLVSSAAKANRPIDGDVIYHAGFDLLVELATLAGKANIHNYSQDEVEGSWYNALDQYRAMSEQDGSLNPDDLKQDFNTLISADKAGKLDQLLPGISKAKKGPVPPPGAPAEAQPQGTPPTAPPQPGGQPMPPGMPPQGGS